MYLDLAGRIPTREAIAFLTDKSDGKRAKVIDTLVNSEGFTSRMFNYFGDMMRVADDANKIKYFTYQEWLKKQIAENRPWNVIVREMLSADGNMLQNGAAGYLLRDKGMKLDNLSLTLTTFLGANVACAQCHDHPFAEWTQSSSTRWPRSWVRRKPDQRPSDAGGTRPPDREAGQEHHAREHRDGNRQGRERHDAAQGLQIQGRQARRDREANARRLSKEDQKTKAYRECRRRDEGPKGTRNR